MTEAGRTFDIAIFDLDRTLTRRGTWTPFVLHLLKHRPARWLLAAPAAFAALAYGARLVSRKQLKNIFLWAAADGLSESQMDAFARDFVARLFAHGMKPRALERLREHVVNDARVIMATASIDVYACLIADRLGVEVVCTETMSDEKGRWRLKSDNCYGDVKAARVAEDLAQIASDETRTRTIAYSDDASDAPLLQMADHAVVVDAKPAFRRRAVAAGFEIACWRNP